jgi:hypothetical protein
MEWEENLGGVSRLFHPPPSILKEEEVPGENEKSLQEVDRQ